MEIVLTAWALNSYLELKHREEITKQDYSETIRPDVLSLDNFYSEPKFEDTKFWSVATDQAKNRISSGFKMNWDNVSLTVGMFADFMLCETYVKGTPKEELRRIARFKVYLELIRRGQFSECGKLS